MRLAVILVFASVVCGLVYFVFTHPGVDRLENLEEELAELQHQNEKLADHNEELKRQIVALRDDPRLAERRARESVGLVRPNELIFQFDEQREVPTIAVRLHVEPGQLQLAGQAVGIDELPERLEALDQQVSSARLIVDVDEAVGPVERQQVYDIVDASSLEADSHEDEG